MSPVTVAHRQWLIAPTGGRRVAIARWQEFEDEKLVVAALLGDVAAFDVLVLRYLPGGVPARIQGAAAVGRPQSLPRLAARHRPAAGDPIFPRRSARFAHATG